MSGSTATKEYSRALSKAVVFDGKTSKWREWSAKFLAIADVHGYERVLLGEEIPVPANQATLTVEEERILKANKEAYSNLVLSCSGTAFGAVDSGKTKDHPRGDARLAWTNLCACFEATDNSTKVELKGEFGKYVLMGKKNPDKWFDELDRLRQRLIQVNSPVDDEDLIIHIMNHLPNEYSELTTTLHAVDFSILNHIELQQKIRAYYKRKVECKRSGEKGLAMAGYTKKFKGRCRECGKIGHKVADCKQKNEGGENKKNLECSNCGKKGHSEMTCWSKKKKSEDKKEDSTVGMFAAAAEVLMSELQPNPDADWELSEMFDVLGPDGTKEKTKDEETKPSEIEEFFAGTAQGEDAYEMDRIKEKWLIDNGASVHITNNNANMRNLEPANVSWNLVLDPTVVLAACWQGP
jgi:hypothetical protein